LVASLLARYSGGAQTGLSGVIRAWHRGMKVPERLKNNPSGTFIGKYQYSPFSIRTNGGVYININVTIFEEATNG
jgi:hypothetical protein